MSPDGAGALDVRAGRRAGRRAGTAAGPAPRLALFGTGVVGSAFVNRWDRLRQQGLPVPALAWLSNSRALLPAGDRPLDALAEVRAAPDGRSAGPLQDDGLRAGDFVVDATASESVAGRHCEWLARGIHVVTANKLGSGGELERAEAIVATRSRHGAHYGDSATVGAGLPLLRSIRELVTGGDRIIAVEGVLSGSLAWLLDQYDGQRPFSGLVREARDRGYTEPDPRQDLSGEDVRRKLLILARAAGLALGADQVRVDPLLSGALAEADADAADALLATLDAPLRERWESAQAAGARLCFVGRVDAEGASVGLQELPAAHPLAAGGGTDNVVAIASSRYREQPLIIRGPGAGAEVTAAALLDDVLRIARDSAAVSTR